MARKSPQDKENKQFFSARFNELLSLHNKKQVDVHRDLNIPKSTITGYVKGTSLPTMGNLQKIADYFGVLKSDIDLRFKNKDDASDDGLEFHLLSNFSKLQKNRQQNVVAYSSNQLKEQLQEENAKVISIKEAKDRYQTEHHVELLGYVSAGTGEYLQDWKPEEILVDNTPDKYDYALKINGNSMEPLFADGQIIFVVEVTNESLFDLSNRIVVADLNGEAYVKKLVVRHDELRLVSLNKKYEDKIVTENDAFYVRGIVVL
ncbi:LexA family transcriptional regulator [Ligilactobacillus murinus]|uniref:LexA family transcriptional regulator n=1 Tax=Ligilactobacillus murinus TaxID=1622 RepID=A0A4S2EQD1_9LACO|nr:XRE family transcriptional regulator [Ligilactobacillus murinus]TGY56893.1 LexA family transcriptional regulator [Ligilactobacillus murinus]